MADRLRLTVMLLSLICLACAGPEKVMTGGSPVADSAERAMALTNFEAPVDPEYVLGLDVPPYPPGVEPISNAVVMNSGDRLADLRWGFDHVRIGARPALLLKTVVAFIREGNSTTVSWRVDDVLVLPEYDAEDRVVYSCSKSDGERVVALGVYRPDLRTVRPVRAAWTIDREASKLVPIDPSSLTCGQR